MNSQPEGRKTVKSRLLRCTNENRYQERKSMTICVNTLCDNNKKAVVASDKMITIEGLSQEFEHETPKLKCLNERCLAVSAGDALLPTELFEEVEKEIKGKSPLSIADIVEQVKNQYSILRRKMVEEEHLKCRGLTVKSFYETMSSLPPQIAIPLDSKIEDYKLDLNILISGLDTKGAHIFEIANPGVSRCFDSIGYSAIGSGYPHAIQSFISNNYNGSKSLDMALFLTYEAKKRAENAPGVGTNTEMWLIRDEGVIKLNEQVINNLDKIYKLKIQKEKIISEEMKEELSKLDLG